MTIDIAGRAADGQGGAMKKREQAPDLVQQAYVEHLDGLRTASESFDAGALDKKIRDALVDWRGLLDGGLEVAR